MVDFNQISVVFCYLNYVEGSTLPQSMENYCIWFEKLFFVSSLIKTIIELLDKG